MSEGRICEQWATLSVLRHVTGQASVSYHIQLLRELKMLAYMGSWRWCVLLQEIRFEEVIGCCDIPSVTKSIGNFWESVLRDHCEDIVCSAARVWLYISVSVLMTGPLFIVMKWILHENLPDKERAITVNSVVFTAFGSLLKQTNFISSQLRCLNFFFVFWYIFCLIIAALYSGVLTATLIIPSFEKPINSLKDLPHAVKKDGYTLAISADTSEESIFKNAIGGIYAETWKLFNHKDRSKSFVSHPKFALDRILTEKLVLISGIVGDKFHAMEKGINNYYFARDTFAPQNYAAVLMSGSPLMPIFNKMLSYMVEGGLILKWEHDEFQKLARIKIINEQKGPRAFTINQLQAAFYILIIGYAAASLAWAIELTAFYVQTMKS
ncbi:glutamate receptor ionotropic, delta-2-like [Palaemon carinicauda]|uniref:glutamate receptor ionotropic, delta-2-like n=1 Tax=Palaemon carinicauda TaxID=392227 RepID=UPI0035B60939